MIATKELELTIEDAKDIADAYIKTVFDDTYFACEGEALDDGYYFMVACTREDMTRNPAVGGVRVAASGDIHPLSEDRIRDMKEAAEVQAAQARGELARDENGLVLRRHARIKANYWTSHHIDHKVTAKGGIFILAQPPIWRFSIQDALTESTGEPLDVIDVDAKTGEVRPLTERQMELVIGGLYVARGLKEQAAAA